MVDIIVKPNREPEKRPAWRLGMIHESTLRIARKAREVSSHEKCVIFVTGAPASVAPWGWALVIGLNPGDYSLFWDTYNFMMVTRFGEDRDFWPGSILCQWSEDYLPEEMDLPWSPEMKARLEERRRQMAKRHA